MIIPISGPQPFLTVPAIQENYGPKEIPGPLQSMSQFIFNFSSHYVS
jgi:hypothetical protein